MEKPNRQEFTREFGARAAAKYATAMRNYRKFLKQKTNPKAASEAARIATAMKREVGTRQSQKVTNAMKRDVNTRKSQRVADAMKRDADKPKSARASTKQQKTATTTTTTTTTTRPSNTRQNRQPGSTGGRGGTPSGTRGTSQPKPQSSRSGGRRASKAVKPTSGENIRNLIRNATNFAKTVGSHKKMTGADGKPKAVINGNLYNIDPKTGRVSGLYKKNFK